MVIIFSKQGTLGVGLVANVLHSESDGKADGDKGSSEGKKLEIQMVQKVNPTIKQKLRS